MREPKNIKRPGLVKSLDILNPKSKVNTLYLIAFKSAMFCRIKNSSTNHDALNFLLRSYKFPVKPSVMFMGLGCSKNNDGEGSKFVTIKTNSRFFKLFLLYSNLPNIGAFH